jgi:DNA-binding winged helix-turn-helix (wHTH) protein
MAMRFAFADFVFDPADRRLRRDGAPVDLNGRYLDALALLVREQGALVSKDRFLGEVWDGVPVTDEALTQCIRTLRRQLGDDASNPRFIETVPKHGYRFIASVQMVDGELPPPRAAEGRSETSGGWRAALTTAIAGTLGGGLAGALGGLVYGFVGASQPGPNGVGALSVLLVLLGISTLVALIGGAGVSVGIAAANALNARSATFSIAGGMAGGLLVGALAKMFGLDAFTLLVGHSPHDITGAGEGAVLGGAVGLSAWLAARARSIGDATARAGIVGGVAGILIGLTGGRLMLGSLALLATEVPGSRLRLDQIGHLFGENGLGPLTVTISCGVEGALFAACVVVATSLARRSARP